MNTLLSGFIAAILLSSSLLVPAAAQAAGLQDAFSDIFLKKPATEAGYNTGTGLELVDIISDVIVIILSLLGMIFMIMMLYSGIRWTTSGGNEQAIDRAKGTIKQAIIGLIVVIGAYALSNFFIRVFG